MKNEIKNNIDLKTIDENAKRINGTIESLIEICKPIDNFIKVTIVINIFTIIVNTTKLFKDLPTTLANKDFTVIMLVILGVFGVIITSISILEEIEYQKLIKDFKYVGESEDYYKEFEEQVLKFYNKYEYFYKIQKVVSDIIKGLSIGFLLYFCATLGPKFNI